MPQAPSSPRPVRWLLAATLAASACGAFPGAPGGPAGEVLVRWADPAAWRVTRGSSAVTVAIVDTGIDARLAAFKGRVATGRDVYAGTGGQTDAHGHGTQVASIAAGAGVGVAPGVRLLPVPGGARCVLRPEGERAGAPYPGSCGAEVGARHRRAPAT